MDSEAALPPPMHVEQPEQIDRRKRRGSKRRAAIVIGTVLILSDGSTCKVLAFDASGNPLCVSQ